MTEAAVAVEVPVWRVLRRSALVDSWRLRFPAAGPDPSWRDRAACYGLPLSFFFEDADAQVLPVCRSCPVRAACGQDAFVHERSMVPAHISGVRGGLRPQVRARFFVEFPELRELELSPAAACGTDAGYHAHLDRGEVTCPECRSAHSAANHARKRRRRMHLVAV